MFASESDMPAVLRLLKLNRVLVQAAAEIDGQGEESTLNSRTDCRICRRRLLQDDMGIGCSTSVSRLGVDGPCRAWPCGSLARPEQKITDISRWTWRSLLCTLCWEVHALGLSARPLGSPCGDDALPTENANLNGYLQSARRW